MIGTILSNRYKIKEKLGSGGMAWVYLADDLLEQRQVAVKILYPQHSQDLSFLQRFMQEARLAMRLSECNPGGHIVCVLDYGSDRDTHYLVMEYVPGRDLGQVLAERGPLPWPEALEIGRQVAMALGHAQQQGIVHRDIKPGNIMISADGRIRVMDFGIARAKGSPELTLAGFVGSPHYAAPEQAMGETVDIRADLYSLGVVLYRVLSGDLPFHGNTPWALANQHIASPPPPLEKTCPDLPAPVIHLVQKALAKRPEDRFQSPADMIEAIENVLAGHDLPDERIPAAGLSLEQLYHHAHSAIEAEDWQKAVDQLNQILNVDPGYRDAAQQLKYVGQQVRLAALYQAAQRMIQLGQWDEALIRLDEIAEITADSRADYRDVEALRAQARSAQETWSEEQASLSDYPTQVETPAGSQPPLQVSTPAGEPPSKSDPDPAPQPRREWRRPWLWILIAILVVAVAGLGSALLRTPGPLVADMSASPTATVAQTSTPTRLPSPPARVLATRVQPSATWTSPVAAPTLPARHTTTPVTVASPSFTPTLTPTMTPSPAPSPPVTAKPAGQIAFPRFDPARGTYDVYACRVDGTNCRRLVAEASQPDFLPDGSQIVVHSWSPSQKGLVLHILAEQRIWRITDQIEAARPSVDFRGQFYVYHSRQEADRQPRLYRTYGTETRPILREANMVVGLAPTWLPDGRILYSGCWRDACGIIAMRADGTNPVQVVAGSTETNPESSPDGKQVAFMSQRDGNWEVYIVNLDGSNLRRLTHSAANDGLPTWSPDGQFIAFATDRDGRWAVWAMRPDGSQQRRLFDIGGPLDGQVRGASSYEIQGWVEERLSWAPMP
jgi:tetratricopeptide (TPR) repeat protein/predicted Ser/Thr protein kinase